MSEATQSILPSAEEVVLECWAIANGISEDEDYTKPTAITEL
jgi:hypothetical protein